MLKVTVDVFSGRPNPQWIVAGDDARKLLESIAKAPEVLDHADPSTLGLGYRGLQIDMLSDDLHRELRMPASFRIFPKSTTGRGVLDRILRTAPSKFTPADLKSFKVKDLHKLVRQTKPSFKFPAPQVITADLLNQIIEAIRKYIEWLRKGGCPHEEIAFDPAFWNDPAHVGINNCYNFASNRRTDTFAQPGRASGHPFTSTDCPHVRDAAIYDGAKSAPPCPPGDQAPRYLVALVIAPVFSPQWPYPDYHWYRRCSGGYWAHKPGGTPARNYDNAGNVIFNPETCNRGPYTVFCGYLYTQKKMVVS